MVMVMSKKKRPRTNYEGGAAGERYIRSKLEKAGFKVVRAAGSKGTSAGAPDLIAANQRVCYAIEVKRFHLYPKKFKEVATALINWIGDALYIPAIVHKKTAGKHARYEFVEVRENA
jgi:Holliday junction resolvase